MIVSSSIPNLVNGVSQQPDSLRLTSQCELQENGYSSVVKGVRKRAPFRHIAQLFNTTGFDGAYLHTINRDATERYCVVITNGDLKVFGIDGTPRTVNFPHGKAYLTNATPSQGFVAITVADYTFIANKSIVTAMDNTSLTTVRNHEAMIYVHQGNYASQYNVYLDGTLQATYTTSATTATDIQTNNIAAQLYNQLVACAVAANYNFVLYGSVVYIQKKASGVDFTLQTTDSLGDVALVPVKDSVQRFASLPVKGINGFVAKVTGDATNKAIGYYVKYVDANSSSTTGSWVETLGQGIATSFDASTMPWQLVRNSDGTFTFDKAAWVPRGCGDDVSCPDPSFIGRTISDILFHRNRLGFLAGENVVFSKAGSFFNMWPDSVTQVLDSDRIDIATTHVKVSTMRGAVPFNDALLMFSDQTQFILDGSDILTPKTVTVKPATEFENDSLHCKPIYTGKSVYFTVPRGAFTGIREFQTLPLNDNKDAIEITSHVPQYVPGGVYRIAASANDGMMAVLTTSDRASFYIYRYFWNGDQKLQSAWSRWVLDPGDVVLSCDFIQTDLYAVIQRSDGVYLEVSSQELGRIDSGFAFQVNLDRRLFITGTYNAVTNLTTWTLPYTMTGGTFQVVLGPAFSSPSRTGTVPNTTAATSSTLTAVGDFSAGPCYVGRLYTFRYRFSKILPREASKTAYGVQQAVLEGRLQLNRLSVVYDQTGYFRAEVTPYARSTSSYQFTGYITGDQSDVIGARPAISGVFRFPILSDSRTVQIDLVNDTYLPSSFQSAEWEGKYYIRSQRL